MKQQFSVTGMTCSACSAHVEKAARKVEGVSDVTVSLLTNSMTVTFDENITSDRAIMDAVIAAGYGAAHPAAAGKGKRLKKPDETGMEQELAQMKRRLIWSFVFLIPLFNISMGHMMGAPLPPFLCGVENAGLFALTQFLLTLPILYLNDKYYKVGFKKLFQGAPNMDSLIAVGSLASLIYGVAALFRMAYGMGHGDWETVEFYRSNLYFESAAMILALVTVGKMLEGRAKGNVGTVLAKGDHEYVGNRKENNCR